MNSTAQRCWRSAARVRWANAPRSARQSPVGSGTSISASIRSGIRSSDASLDAQQARTSQASHAPATVRLKLARSYSVLLWYIVLERTTYEYTGSDDGRDPRHPGGRTGQDLREDKGAVRVGPDGAGRDGL